MTGWIDTATVFLAFHEVTNETFVRLRGSMPDAIAPEGPTLNTFTGMHGTGGAGMSAFITARHEDGRAVYWQVEIWLDRDQNGDGWWATVKGEIDLDDDAGHDRCVLNEQRSVATASEAAAAIRELGSLVAGYPLDHLLAMRWGPESDSAEGDLPNSV
jgi:hypothetical protein